MKDIIDLLQRWPTWKRVQDAPDRVDELEKRVAALEGRLQRAPGEACPRCGALDLRVEKSEPSKTPLGRLGARDVHHRCGACGYADVRLTK